MNVTNAEISGEGPENANPAVESGSSPNVAIDDKARGLPAALGAVITSDRAIRWGAPVVSLGLVVFAWWVATAIFSMPAYILPNPVDVLRAIIETGPMLWTHVLTTISETLEGFAIAIVIGVAVSLFIVSSKTAERLIYPLLVTTQAVPKVAMAPIFLAWFGLGSTPRIIIACLLAVFPIIINLTLGFIEIDKGLLLFARSAGAKASVVFLKVRLPAALPGFFSGLKLGVTLALVGAVVGEFVGGDSGLGYIVTRAQGNLNTALSFAAIVLLALIGVLLFYLVEAVERRFIRW